MTSVPWLEARVEGLVLAALLLEAERKVDREGMSSKAHTIAREELGGGRNVEGDVSLLTWSEPSGATARVVLKSAKKDVGREIAASEAKIVRALTLDSFFTASGAFRSVPRTIFMPVYLGELVRKDGRTWHAYEYLGTGTTLCRKVLDTASSSRLRREVLPSAIASVVYFLLQTRASRFPLFEHRDLKVDNAIVEDVPETTTLQLAVPGAKEGRVLRLRSATYVIDFGLSHTDASRIGDDNMAISLFFDRFGLCPRGVACSVFGRDVVALVASVVHVLKRKLRADASIDFGAKQEIEANMEACIAFLGRMFGSEDMWLFLVDYLYVTATLFVPIGNLATMISLSGSTVVPHAVRDRPLWVPSTMFTGIREANDAKDQAERILTALRKFDAQPSAISIVRRNLQIVTEVLEKYAWSLTDGARRELSERGIRLRSVRFPTESAPMLRAGQPESISEIWFQDPLFRELWSESKTKEQGEVITLRIRPEDEAAPPSRTRRRPMKRARRSELYAFVYPEPLSAEEEQLVPDAPDRSRLPGLAALHDAWACPRSKRSRL